MPDELFPAYLARCRRDNFLCPADDLAERLGYVCDYGSKGSFGDKFRFIVNHLGWDAKTIVCRHTLTPLSRLVWFKTKDPVGFEEPDSFRTTAKYGSVRRFCEDCAKEDEANGWPRYWRRAHQLVGMLWCSRHRTPLVVCPSDHGLWNAPAIPKHFAKYDSAVTRLLDKYPALQRYSRVVETVLSCVDSSSPSSDVGAVIRHRVRSAGFEGEEGKRLWELVGRSFPYSWLSMHFPRALAAGGRTGVGGVLSQGWCISEYYALALAVLWDDPVEAVKKVFLAREFDLEKWDVAQHVSVWFESQGDITRASKKLGSNRSTVEHRFWMIGLPGFGVRRFAAVGDALRMQQQGHSREKILTAFGSEREIISRTLSALDRATPGQDWTQHYRDEDRGGWSDDTALALWMRHAGKMSSIAAAENISLTTVRFRYRRLGLPRVHRRSYPAIVHGLRLLKEGVAPEVAAAASDSVVADDVLQVLAFVKLRTPLKDWLPEFLSAQGPPVFVREVNCWSNDRIIKLWMIHRGSVADCAAASWQRPRTVSKRWVKLGLPALRDGEFDSVRDALRERSRGRSIGEICARYGEDSERIRKLLEAVHSKTPGVDWLPYCQEGS